jgi:hypothetical protein
MQIKTTGGIIELHSTGILTLVAHSRYSPYSQSERSFGRAVRKPSRACAVPRRIDPGAGELRWPVSISRVLEVGALRLRSLRLPEHCITSHAATGRE